MHPMLILSQAYLNGPVFEKCHHNMSCGMLISNQQIYTHIGKVLAKDSNSNRLQNTQSKKQQNILNVTLISVPFFVKCTPACIFCSRHWISHLKASNATRSPPTCYINKKPSMVYVKIIRTSIKGRKRIWTKSNVETVLVPHYHKCKILQQIMIKSKQIITHLMRIRFGRNIRYI